MSIIDEQNGKASKVEGSDCTSNAEISNQCCIEDNKSVEHRTENLTPNLQQIKLPFPWKVQEMLTNVENDGNSHIVSWMPHGKSFRVHREEDFVSSIMPTYFNQSKFTSFTRQLYIYGFQKVQDGPDKGAFFHDKFLREYKSLCLTMKRKRDKPFRNQTIPLHAPFFSPNQSPVQEKSLLRKLAQSHFSSGVAHVCPEVPGNPESRNTFFAGLASDPNGPFMPPSVPRQLSRTSVFLSPFGPFFKEPTNFASAILQNAQQYRDFRGCLVQADPHKGSNGQPKNTEMNSSLQVPCAVFADEMNLEQVDHEEDWLAKFERLTASGIDSNYDATPLNIPPLTDIYQPLYSRHLREEERILPRIRVITTKEPCGQWSCCTNESKDLGTLSDGDEVDFDGMKFFFLEP